MIYPGVAVPFRCLQKAPMVVVATMAPAVVATTAVAAAMAAVEMAAMVSVVATRGEDVSTNFGYGICDDGHDC